MIPWREGRHGSLATGRHAFRGGSAAVAEKNDKRRSKHPRILRAADVIPPFNQDMTQADEPADPAEIPTFDLADNMLAEHRQMAARRRKAPSQMQTEPEIRAERRVMSHVVEPPSQDLREMQRVVAEIVARDIQRLCSRPGMPPRG